MKRSFIGMLGALVGLFGCSSSEGEVKLGVDVAPITVADTGAQQTNAERGATGLDITSVRLLVAHAKVGYIGERETGPAADIGPTVIELTADEIANGAHRELSLGTLPSDTYGGAEIEIEPLDVDTTDAHFADFRDTGASVLVGGTYAGKEFQFAGHFLAEQGTDGDVTIDAAKPVALAMTVDPSTWLLDGAGKAVDPADATQHDALAVAICKTLDTQPQTGPAGGGGKGGRGGPAAHCVEASE